MDERRRRQLRPTPLDEAQLAAESDHSPGVLLASGYIAGGAIGGIIIALMAGVLGRLDFALTQWASSHNPFFAGPQSDWLALLPFAALTWWLCQVGRKARPSPAPSGADGTRSGECRASVWSAWSLLPLLVAPASPKAPASPVDALQTLRESWRLQLAARLEAALRPPARKNGL